MLPNLGNSNLFVFYVDHIKYMALVYLINKPQVFNWIARWLLFLEYDINKLGRSHLMVDALSRLPNQAKVVGVPNQTIDVHMFTLHPEWLQNVYDYLLEGMMPKWFIISQRQYLVQITKPRWCTL